MVVIRVGAVDASGLTEIFHQIIAAGHGAGQGPANADMVFAGGGLAEARVKRDDFEDLDRFEPELGGHPVHGLRLNEPKFMLQKVQERQHRATGRDGIVGYHFVYFRQQLGWKGHGSD